MTATPASTEPPLTSSPTDPPNAGNAEAQTQTPVQAQAPVRADARRNIERILDQAARVLADDNSAGMAAIARASGVGRATLYRHFPTRERLIEAIRERALAETARAISGSRLEEGSFAQALGRLTAALLEIGDRYRVLVDEARTRPGNPKQAPGEDLAAPLYALVERGQASGELSPKVSPQWVLAVMGSILVTGIQMVSEGAITREQAPALVTRTLLSGLRAGSADERG